MEYLAIKSDLDLKTICAVLEKALLLSPFAYDYENETEWGTSVTKELSINVSKPFDQDTLAQWDPMVPEGCNVGITLHKTNLTSTDTIQIGKTIAKELGTNVYHYRTFLKPGNNIKRDTWFSKDG